MGADLTDRERDVLEAVVRRYVDTAEPAGSRTVSRNYGLGISAATVRNTMSDLEEKGYLFHPHASAGRVPTDLAYRFFVDSAMSPRKLSVSDRRQLRDELGAAGSSALERLVRQAVRALSLLSHELGVAVAPHLDRAKLERIELIKVSTSKVMAVTNVSGGVVRTLYADLRFEVASDTLVRVTQALNERLAGLTLAEIRSTLSERLRDSHGGEPGAEEFVNIFVQSAPELFNAGSIDEGSVLLGHTSVLAAQPEFERNESLRGLIKLTERRDLLAQAVGGRDHGGGLMVTIGGENSSAELNDFTLVTSEYSAGGLRGVIGVIGPTRMPYEKVVAIVDYTSSVMTRMLHA